MWIADSTDSFSCAQRCRFMVPINLNIRVLTIEIENDFQFHLWANQTGLLGPLPMFTLFMNVGVRAAVC